MANGSGLQSNGPRLEIFSDYQVDLFLGHLESKSFNIFVINEVREKFSYPLDKHCIKFGCPKPKSSCPKCFARFLSQMELIQTNEMAMLWQS